MKILLSVLQLILCLAANLQAQNPNNWFEEANKLYATQDYEKAAETYLKIVQSGYESAELYYNLGNCYYKLNKIGSSILYYEKALKAAPDNEDIQFNLSLALLRVNDRIEPAPEMILLQKAKDFLHAKTANQWGRISLLFIWIASTCFAIFLFIKTSSVKRASFFSAILTIFLALIFFILAIQQHLHERNNKFGVIMVTNTYVKSSPDKNSTDLFMLREGTKFQILEKLNSWLKIKLVDGKVGWINETDISLI